MSQLTFLVMFFFSKEAQDIKIKQSRMFTSLVRSSENKMGQKYLILYKKRHIDMDQSHKINIDYTEVIEINDTCSCTYT